MAVEGGNPLSAPSAVVCSERRPHKDAFWDSLVFNAAYERAPQESLEQASDKDLWSTMEFDELSCTSDDDVLLTTNRQTDMSHDGLGAHDADVFFSRHLEPTRLRWMNDQVCLTSLKTSEATVQWKVNISGG